MICGRHRTLPSPFSIQTLAARLLLTSQKAVFLSALGGVQPYPAKQDEGLEKQTNRNPAEGAENYPWNSLGPEEEVSSGEPGASQTVMDALEGRYKHET